MSGGFFEYRQHCISNIIDDMEKLLLSGNFPFEIEGEIKDCISLLRKSYVYVQRIDWFLSDDDGYETFLVRLKEDLASIECIDSKYGRDKDTRSRAKENASLLLSCKEEICEK